MPQPNKIPLAFAASGDKNVIPESTETTGLASWRDGFPAITSVPFSEGGIAPKRADFNGIFNALSQAVMWMQQGGVYAYDVNTDYEDGNIVLDGGGLYVANAANGPSSAVVQPSSDTTGATWKPVRLNLATQSAAGYMSAADKAALDGVPTTYLPLTGGDLTGPISVNGQALDTLEVGTWTPELRGSSTTGAFTYTAQNGEYYKFGPLVYVYGQLVPSACTALPVGTVQITGLPYTVYGFGGARIMTIGARANGFDSNSAQKLIGFFAGGGSTVMIGRVIATDSNIGLTAFQEAVWSNSSSTAEYIKVTAKSYSSTGLNFAGWYLATV